MNNLKSIIDVDTVMGSPVKLPDGGVIIPVTKVSVGFVAGGGEYTGDNMCRRSGYPFSGGSGSGFSIKPIGFLVKNENEKYELISIQDEPAYKKLADLVTNLATTYIKSQAHKGGNNTENDDSKEK